MRHVPPCGGTSELGVIELRDLCAQAMNLLQKGIFSQDDFKREKALLDKKRLGSASTNRVGEDSVGEGKAASTEGRG